MTELLPLNTSPLPVRLRVDDYLLLDAAGAFEAYRKTELLAGEIVYMNAQHRPHARIKFNLARKLADTLDLLAIGLQPMIEASIAMPPHDAPEPDIVLTDAVDGEGLVPLGSVALVIEVADTTLANDLGRKAALYAGHGIAEYWVVDVGGRRVHQMWMPTDGRYAERRETAFGATLAAVTVAGLVVETVTL